MSVPLVLRPISGGRDRDDPLAVAKKRELCPDCGKHSIEQAYESVVYSARESGLYILDDPKLVLSAPPPVIVSPISSGVWEDWLESRSAKKGKKYKTSKNITWVSDMEEDSPPWKDGLPYGYEKPDEDEDELYNEDGVPKELQFHGRKS